MESITAPSVDELGHLESPSVFGQYSRPRAILGIELQVLGNGSDCVPAYDCQGCLIGALSRWTHLGTAFCLPVQASTCLVLLGRRAAIHAALPDTWPVFRAGHMHGSDMQTDVTRGGMVDVARQGWRKFATLEFPDVHLESRFVRHIGASSEPLMR